MAGSRRARPNEKDNSHGNFDLYMTFIAFKRVDAISADWPPDRKVIPGTAAGTARKRHFTVASATLSATSCFEQVNPGNYHVRFQNHTLQHHSLCVKLIKNHSQDLLSYLEASLHGMTAVHENFRLNDWNQTCFLA